MAIKETQGNFEFDQVDRSYKRDTTNAIANSIYHSKNQEEIPENLIYFLDMYRDSGKLSYDGSKKRFLSHYIPAIEFGAIRSSKPYRLSNLAIEMVEGEINPKEYISIVMLNYMESLNGEIKNLMHCVLEVINKLGNEINLDQLIEEEYFREKSYTRILIKLLNSTYYFKKSENDEILNFNSDIFKIERLLEITAKREADAAELGVEYFRNQENYSDFITVNNLDDYKFKTEQNKIIEIFSNSELAENKKKLKKVGSYQKIVYGAPGTGKSYSLAKEAESLFSDFSVKSEILDKQNPDISFWLVGATWGNDNKYDEFINNNYWINGWDDGQDFERAKNMKIEDYIIIKTGYFTGKKNSTPTLGIKAIGKVTKISQSGKQVEVNWLKKNLDIVIKGENFRSTVHNISKRISLIDKIFTNQNLLNSYSEDIKTKERVTFYDGYTYGQFVGAYKPVPIVDENEKADITYNYIPGPLFRHLVKAFNNPEHNFVLIIEEINRARADRVFGNVFQLLDRDKEGKSEYPISLSEEQDQYFRENISGERYAETIGEKGGLYLPDNLYIWCTMNSADQGVYPMDSAFKRRWDFEYIGLNENENSFGKDNCKYYLQISEDKNVEWNIFRTVINENLLSLNIPEDRLIAPFFIKEENFKQMENETNIFILEKNVYESKILMYLFDDILRHRGRNKIFSEEINSFSKLIENSNSKNDRVGEEKKSIFSSKILKDIAEKEEELKAKQESKEQKINTSEEV